MIQVAQCAVDVILIELYIKLVAKRSFDLDDHNVISTDNRHSFITDNYYSS